jgi:hypothetical protein
MKSIIPAILCLIVITIGFLGCALGGEDNPFAQAPVFPYIKGKITVADSAYWDYIQIGVFFQSGNSADDSYHLGYAYDTNNVFRMNYANAMDGSTVLYTPMVTNWEIASKTGTECDYYIDLPATRPAASNNLQVVAWYDTNLDNKIELKDSFTTSVIQQGEFNRYPTTTLSSAEKQVTTFYDGGSNYAGYKFNAQPGNFLANQLSSDNSSNFNFNISANTGW